MKRTVYVVRTKHGFLGTVRYKNFESVRNSDMPFETARVFTRAQDAKAAADHKNDEVIWCVMRGPK